MARLRTAVIGCGAVSRNHGKALQDNQYAELCYAVDIDREKAEAFSRTYGGEVLTDYRDLFDRNIDVAHVVTPHNTHPEIAIDLMKHGISVFCEKPLAINAYDAKRMVAVSEETGMRLGVCFQNRLNQSTVEAKEIIDSGRYGRIISGMALVAWDRHGKYYSESPWRGKYQGEGGGCIINQSIHTLDLLDYLTGGVESLSAFDAKLRDTDDYEVDDSAMILFRLKNGGTAVGYCTNCYPGSKICQVELRLERAVMLVSQGGLRIEEEDGNVIFHSAKTLKGEKSEWGVSHGLMINEFYRTLISGEDYICDCHTGLAAVEIVNAIQHSKGKFISIR
ncbi:MAG: Gfo/Idh/MocA family oxidoreductase [Candidatus Ornithospirochaeta sp.]|nr:Gfo/Idh/MocA family oxidoreductase [Candidatus Ornithospirochaeta sp.]